MRRIPIHIKLAAGLIVPLLLFVAVALVEAIDARSHARDVRSEASMVRASVGPSGLFNALQDERARAAIELVGVGGGLNLTVEDNAAAREQTDQAQAEFAAGLSRQPAEVQDTFEDAMASLDQLRQLRTDIDAVPGPYTIENNLEATLESFTRYTSLIRGLLNASVKVSTAISDAELRQGANVSQLTSRQSDLLAQLLWGVGEMVLIQQPDRRQLQRVSGLMHGFKNNEHQITATAGKAYRPLIDKSYPEPTSRQVQPLVDQVLTTGTAADPQVIDQVISLGDMAAEGSYLRFREQVNDQLASRADRLTDEAQGQADLYTMLAVGSILLALAGTWLISRSITKPLGSLTRQATDIARHRLPRAVTAILSSPTGEHPAVPEVEPVTIQTPDELTKIAHALNTMQERALELAVEQTELRHNIAEWFVNLGRRNQNILGRQLDFITELEEAEADPATRADLLRLDHLATRMRRNAESLLVLADVEVPRRWAAPVSMVDAVTAALGEVEEPHRVDTSGVEPITISGSIAVDLAHLLAELIENALTFSPPDQTVLVRGGHGPAGYALEVVDAGLGMTADELSLANARLSAADTLPVAPSRYLGHFVAGKLAARHRIDVMLHCGVEDRGITALVSLPSEVLTGVSDLPPEAPARV